MKVEYIDFRNNSNDTDFENFLTSKDFSRQESVLQYWEISLRKILRLDNLPFCYFDLTVNKAVFNDLEVYLKAIGQLTESYFSFLRDKLTSVHVVFIEGRPVVRFNFREVLNQEHILFVRKQSLKVGLTLSTNRYGNCLNFKTIPASQVDMKEKEARA